MKLENLPPVYKAYSEEYPDLTVCRVVLQEKDLYHVIHKNGMIQCGSLSKTVNFQRNGYHLTKS